MYTTSSRLPMSVFIRANKTLSTILVSCYHYACAMITPLYLWMKNSAHSYLLQLTATLRVTDAA
jgi:hypothetical protein